ncbi:hypothetical protein EFP02_07305 [Lactiplantibacillus plantarum]|uniref:hypothetical protein n=1 Tax=Lactiplantibacillus plantarum TaxID=1590 RepID=UPI0021A32341|nr:hypothetical protein [Lactiplantibacillus plantarum]MCT3246858.1 hypothetical protein [Lactiplantibacillus plantarum]
MNSDTRDSSKSQSNKPRTIDLTSPKLLASKGHPFSQLLSPIQNNMARNISITSRRFHFYSHKNRKSQQKSLFDAAICYDSRTSPLYLFEAMDWLALLTTSNLQRPIGTQTDQTKKTPGAYSLTDSTSDYIEYTKHVMKNIDHLKSSYGYLHIKASKTYANTASLLTAYDWFQDSALREFIKALNTRHSQDKSRLLLVFVYWINNMSFELLNADVLNNLDDLLGTFMKSIVGEFNPILKQHETTDTTIAELIAQQIFYEYRYTSWKRPDNPYVYLNQDTDSPNLPTSDYNLENSQFIEGLKENVHEITTSFSKYFKSDDMTGFIDYVFFGLAKQQMEFKYSNNLRISQSPISKLKNTFISTNEFSRLRTIDDKNQRWKQLLTELDKFLNSTNINVKGLLATITNIQSLEQRSSIESRQHFWERISNNLATPEEIKSERKKQVDQRQTSKRLVQNLMDYLGKQASYDETLSDEEWLQIQKKIYKRQQEIAGLPSDSTIPSDLLNTILKP